MTNDINKVVVMDLTKVASTFPQLADPMIKRENMISTLTEMLRTDTEVLIVEGPDGIGKTTLLAQFACEHSHNTFSLFIRSSSRWAYDSGMLTRNLCDQIGWALAKEDFRSSMSEMDPFQLYAKRLLQLQRKANVEQATYYFVVDGLSEIPEEDRHEREMVLKLLPFGLRPFRFILSGPLACLKKGANSLGVANTFRLTGFTFEETRQFLSDLVDDQKALQTIYKVSKNPGNLASVRRLLQSGKNPSQLLEELPAHLPDLFELEWRTIDEEDAVLRLALAILAFDRRKHSSATLSRLCKVPRAEIEKKLACCHFIERLDDGATVEFVCEVFKKFVGERLSTMRRSVLDLIISDLLASPETNDALTHLPGFLHQAERYEDLLHYLSPAHVGRLIDCGESWIPLHQKAALGVDTALHLSRDGDLLRFGLQRAAISGMEAAEPWRSEIEAYVALSDFTAAYALAQRMVTREDRLHLLAVIASAKKTRSLPIETELSDQIQQLYRLLDRNSLGPRGVEIASDLLYTHPELAIELVQDCTAKADKEDGLDIALTQLSFKALTQRNADTALAPNSTQQALRAKIKNPEVQKFLDRLAFFFGGYSAEGVLAEVGKWENSVDRIFALRMWTSTTSARKDAAVVIEFALNTILETTTYTANAKVYQELSQPLIHLPDLEKVKSIIGRLDGLKGTIESAGPTEEYVKFQAVLSEAEARYDRQAACDRLQDLYFNIDNIKDPSTKLASLAILARILKTIDPGKQFETQTGIHTEVLKAFKAVVDVILTRTADHYEAVRPAIAALSRSDPKIALEVISKLNTSPRREAALVKFVEAIASEPPSVGNFDAMEIAYGMIKAVSMQGQASSAAVRGLMSRKQDLAPVITRVFSIRIWVESIPDAEERCQALCSFLQILLEHKPIVPPALLEDLTSKLREAWEAVDVGWSKVDAGFKIVSAMSKCSAEISRDFLARTERVRKQIVLDCQKAATSYIGCVRLAIRSFHGLIKRRLYSKDDMTGLADLIDRIPATGTRVLAWCELALRFYLMDDLNRCQDIVSQRVRLTIESDTIRDAEALWGVTVSAAPALYCAHNASAKQLFDKLPEEYRDEAYATVCRFLITKQLPTEAYDTASRLTERLTYAEFLDIYDVLQHLRTDVHIYFHLELLVDAIQKHFRNAFNRTQIADILQKLGDLAKTKLPNPDHIQHEGYRILAEAQIARLDRGSPWDDLAQRARGIPNVADSAFVLMQIAAALPSREQPRAVLLAHEAKALIPQIGTYEDRCSRYDTLAHLSADFDKQLSKECIRLAWNETIPQDEDEVPKTRRKLIDFAYRLDPEFAASLASETEKDPGREFARAEARERLESLKLRESVASGEDRGLSPSADTDQQVEVCRMLLRGLNSGRTQSMHIDRTRPYVKLASRMSLQEAYPVLCWVIENAVRRYMDTDQANTILRALYDASRLSGELAYRIAVRLRSATDMGIIAARTADVSGDLIHAGEREKALARLKEWASHAVGFVKITDPYFGPEELELIKLIREVNPKIPIYVLTGRKHQQDSGVQQPWDETYQAHWRMKVSDADTSELTIVVVGKSSNGEHPIHDRWWLSDRSGLRIGTSANSLGIGKLSEISNILDSEVTARVSEVDRFLTEGIREIGTDRVKYVSFSV